MKKHTMLIASAVALSMLVAGTFTFAANSTATGGGNRMHTMNQEVGSEDRPALGLGMGMEMGRRGGPGKGMGMGMGMMGSGASEQMEAVRTAIQNNDYAAYKTAYTKAMMTQAQFNDMVAQHKQMTAMRDAITSNDYTAYIAAVKGTPMEGKVSKEQFATMVQREQQRGQKTSATQ